MKPLRFFLISLLFLSQLHAQTPWTLDLLSVPSNFNGIIGTQNNRSFHIFSNSNQRATFDSIGNFKINSLSGSNDRLLFVDENGQLKPVGGGGYSSPCISGSIPWYEGGNTVVGSNKNKIGTCNDLDFILQAYAKPLLFIKSTNYIGIGPNNNNPSAQLDITDGSSSDHMLFSGDVNGRISSTSDLNLHVATGKSFFINEGISNYTSHFNIIYWW